MAAREEKEEGKKTTYVSAGLQFYHKTPHTKASAENITSKTSLEWRQLTAAHVESSGIWASFPDRDFFSVTITRPAVIYVMYLARKLAQEDKLQMAVYPLTGTAWNSWTALFEAFEWQKYFEKIVIESIT